MRGTDKQQVSMLSLVTPDRRVPAGHPLRRVKVLADQALAALSPTFDEMYSKKGRPSIPPERLLKATLLIAFHSIRRLLNHDVAAQGLRTVQDFGSGDHQNVEAAPGDHPTPVGEGPGDPIPVGRGRQPRRVAPAERDQLHVRPGQQAGQVLEVGPPARPDHADAKRPAPHRSILIRPITAAARSQSRAAAA